MCCETALVGLLDCRMGGTRYPTLVGVSFGFTSGILVLGHINYSMVTHHYRRITTPKTFAPVMWIGFTLVNRASLPYYNSRASAFCFDWHYLRGRCSIYRSKTVHFLSNVVLGSLHTKNQNRQAKIACLSNERYKITQYVARKVVSC